MREYQGTCFCGGVEVQVSGEPVDMGYCHCTSCRTYSGAPFVAFTIWQADKVKVSGDVGSYNKVGTSERRFCRQCGGHFLLDHPQLGLVDIRAAILPELLFKPQSHLFYAQRVISVADGLPKFRDLPAAIGGSGDLVEE